ncbi:MAG: hypothetical protein ABEH81_16445 [Halopenitus sp.]
MSDDFQEAKKLYKRCKVGFYNDLSELDNEEIGLLYRYFPETLPHTDWPEESR